MKFLSIIIVAMLLLTSCDVPKIPTQKTLSEEEKIEVLNLEAQNKDLEATQKEIDTASKELEKMLEEL